MINVTFFNGPVVVLGGGKYSGIFSRHTARHEVHIPFGQQSVCAEVGVGDCSVIFAMYSVWLSIAVLISFFFKMEGILTSLSGHLCGFTSPECFCYFIFQLIPIPEYFMFYN